MRQLCKIPWFNQKNGNFPYIIAEEAPGNASLCDDRYSGHGTAMPVRAREPLSVNDSPVL